MGAKLGVQREQVLAQILIARIANLLPADGPGRAAGHLVGEPPRLPSGVGQQLHLAGVVQRNEPEKRRFERGTDGQESVMLQDQRLACAERARDELAFLITQHDAGVQLEHLVVLEERARILRNGVQFETHARPGLAVRGMAVRGCQHFGPCFMDGGVHGERCGVERAAPLEHLPLVVHQQQVVQCQSAEVATIGIDPEARGPQRVTHGDVSGRAPVEPQHRQHAAGDDQFAPPTRVLRVRVSERRGDAERKPGRGFWVGLHCSSPKVAAASAHPR